MPDYKNYNEDRSKKICSVCTNMLDVLLFRVREKKKGPGKGKFISNSCRKCEQLQVEDYRLTDVGIAAEIVRRHKHVCKQNNLPFDLDRQWVLDKLNAIEWKCELTGLPFNPKRDRLGGKRQGFQWDSISMDRVLHKGGYTKDNVRFVLNQINVFRQDHSDEQMYMIAEALLCYKSKHE